jgi:hypothetical protein
MSILRALNSKGLVAGCHSFCLFFIFYNIHTFIHSITYIQYIYPSPFAEASLHFLIACLLSGETPHCGAEPGIELGPALQQALNSGLLYEQFLVNLYICTQGLL